MEKTYGEDYNKDFDTYAKANLAISVGGLLVGGLGKGIAKLNQKKAYGIYGDLKKQHYHLYTTFEECSERTKKTISDVVCKKKQIMSNHMRKFLKSYERLAPQISLQDSPGLGELRRFVVGEEEYKEIRCSSDAYSSYNELELGKKAANVALLMVQDGTVSNIASSIKEIIEAGMINDDDLKRVGMDNLKIQSIGVIAQFSPIAFQFGISGMSDFFSSRRQIDEAKELAAQYARQIEILNINITKINAIEEYANIHFQLLERFMPLMDEYINKAVQIIKSKDNILHLGRIKESKFSSVELDMLAFTFSLVGAVKAVIDSPIISKNGEVYNEDRTDFEIVRRNIGVYEKKYIEMNEYKYNQ